MNNSKASGVFNETKGKIKQAVGETFNDQKMANEGAADQVKGHAQQAWGSVKDTAHNVANDRPSSDPAYSNDPAYRNEHNTGHDVRTGITNAAANVKESIQRGLDHIDHKHNK
jgi:uncharacterized protein YjbJ (UPF0337 family)